MSCDRQDRTRAWLNGDLADDGEIERHVAGCAQCQALEPEPLGAHATRFAAPELLRRRVLRALEGERPASRFWLGALSGSLGTALAAALAFLLILPPSAASLADAVTDAHARAMMANQTIMVASSDHHTVKPWFASHVPLSPPVVDFASEGFVLAGGRIDSIAGHDSAVIVYRHGRHVLDLFVWADSHERLPQSGMRHGYRIAFWKAHDLDYAAVSDVDANEFAKFLALARKGAE